MHATGNLRNHQIMIASIVLTVIPIAYIMLKMGYSGTIVLIVNAFSNIACAIGRTVYMRRLINLNLNKYLKEVVLPISLVTILSVPIPIYLSQKLVQGWGSLIVISSVAMVSVVVSSYLVALNKVEKQQIKRMPVINKLFKTR